MFFTNRSCRPKANYVFLLFFFLFITLTTFSQEVELQTPLSPEGDVSCLAVSPNGKYIVAGYTSSEIIIKDIKTGKSIKPFLGHSDEILSLSFTPNGKQLLSHSKDKSCKLWDFNEGIEAKALRSTRWNNINFPNFIGNDKIVYQDEYSIDSYDLRTNKKSVFFDQRNSSFAGLATSNDGKYSAIAIGNQFGLLNRAVLSKNVQFVFLVDNKTQKKIKTFYKGWGRMLRFSPDGRYLSFKAWKYIKVYDIHSKEKSKDFNSKYKEVNNFDIEGQNIRHFEISADNKYILIVSNKKIEIYDLISKKVVFSQQAKSRIKFACFMKNPRHVVISNDKRISIVDFTMAKEINIFEQESIENFSIGLSSSNIKLNNKKSKTLNLKTGKIEKFLELRKNTPVSSNNFYNIQNNKISVYEKNTGKVLSGVITFPKIYKDRTRKDSIYLLQESNEQTYIVDLKNETILDVKKDYVIEITENKKAVSVEIISDNRIGYNKKYHVKIWDIEMGDTIKTFKNVRSLKSVRFSNDGKHLVICKSIDVLLWDIENKKLKTKKEIFTGFSSLTKDNKSLLAIDEYKIRVIDLETNQVNYKLRPNYNYDYDRDDEIFEKNPFYSINISNDKNRLIVWMNQGVQIYDLTYKGYGFSKESIIKEFEAGSSYKLLKNNSDVLVINEGNNTTLWDLSKDKVLYSSKTTLNNFFYPEGLPFVFAQGNGFFKILEKETYVELLTFFNLKEKEWIVTTPDGKFDASPDAFNKLYYVKGLKLIPLENLMEKYYTPKLWERVMKGEKFKELDVDISELKLPPLVKIVSPAPEGGQRGGANRFNKKTKLTESKVEVTVKATDQGGGIDEIRLYVNGKLYENTQRGLKPATKENLEQTKTFIVNLVKGENIIKATAFNTQRTEAIPDKITLFYEGVKKTSNLYVFVIGVDEYKNPRHKLNYAIADASSFKQEVEDGGQNIFGSINSVFIKDEEATKTKISTEFEKAKKSIKPEDVLIFYYSGHGVMSDENQPEFYIVPYDVTQLYGNNQMLKTKAISAGELQEFSKQVKAQKQLFVLDACQSGGIVEQLTSSRGAAEEKAIAQLARSTGTFWLTASNSEQFATEFKTLGHGVFTYAILKGLKGEADGGNKDKKITVKELSAFLNEKVVELSLKHKGTVQYPTSYGFGQDFPIVIIKE